MNPPAPTDLNLYEASEEELKGIAMLPLNFTKAMENAKSSDFVKAILPQRVIETFNRRS